MDYSQIDTSGFYSGEALLRAGLFVYGPKFTLEKDHRAEYNYPVNGWVWCDDVYQASALFNVEIEDWNLDLPTDQ